VWLKREALSSNPSTKKKTKTKNKNHLNTKDGFITQGIPWVKMGKAGFIP
jgi:hypothetical protein